MRNIIFLLSLFLFFSTNIEAGKKRKKGKKCAKRAIDKKLKSIKKSYVPTVLKVENMSQFFNSKWGKTISPKNKPPPTKPTTKIFHGQRIFISKKRIQNKNGETLMDNGYRFYLDGQHKDHLEVFDTNCNFVRAINLNGKINEEKTAVGRKEKRDIKSKC